MPRQPGFLDEGGGRELPDAVPPTPTVNASAESTPPAGPMLLEVDGASQDGRLDVGWAPARIQPPPARASSLSWLAAGVALGLLGWAGLSAVAFVHDQFARSPWLGGLSLVVVLAVVGLVLTGVLTELRSYRALQRVDALRAALARPDLPLSEAQVLCRPWLDVVAARLPEPEAVRRAVQAAATLPELRAVLRARVLAPLGQASKQAAQAAALQGGAVVAIVPSPALDGVFTGLRGLTLVRQVAQLHGLRPGLAVSLSLLRRLAWTAAGVSGLDLLAQSAADHALDVELH